MEQPVLSHSDVMELDWEPESAQLLSQTVDAFWLPRKDTPILVSKSLRSVHHKESQNHGSAASTWGSRKHHP